MKLLPEVLTVDQSSTGTFLCNVSHTSGTNALSILWLKDGVPLHANPSGSGNFKPLSDSSRYRLIEPHVLNIRNVVREDAGEFSYYSPFSLLLLQLFSS